MPRILLTQQFSDNPPIVRHKTKTDYFDTRLTGFFLEVRATGKGTYYQRYRDRHRRNRQIRIGPADAMTLEEAREAARQVRSGITNGFDPSEQARKRKEVPLFSEFVENRYLPHVKVYKRSWGQDERGHLCPVGEYKPGNRGMDRAHEQVRQPPVYSFVAGSDCPVEEPADQRQRVRISQSEHGKAHDSHVSCLG